MPAFDPRGANEAGFPWEKDYARIRPEYFNQADQRLFYLVDQGFVPCIVGAWGYHLPWLGTAADEGALALPDRPLRRAAGCLVRGGRGHDALLRLEAPKKRHSRRKAGPRSSGPSGPPTPSAG